MVDRIRGISGVTPFAPMPQAPLNFPNSVRLNVEAIDKLLANALLSVVAGVANGNIITLSDPDDDRLVVFKAMTDWLFSGLYPQGGITAMVFSWRNVLRKTR
ncbi:Hypothetical predicted protein [Paramuricea clavata]|uniref:Uncharacterized protein n=1 Tax=Paramuricea clavata TaxID=317549 RepID=A0A7D9DA73_PARCT|nr:Hypothetical predicted protein [Paramuricea clavata]